MLLESITIQNFRCYESIVDLSINKLTIFIGENDSGKTAILDAICMLMTSKSPIPSDFRLLDQTHLAGEILISGTFKIEDHDSIPTDLCSQDGDKLVLTKKFQERTIFCEVECLGFENEQFNTFENQKADNQKELLRNIGLKPGKNKRERLSQFRQAVDSNQIARATCNKVINFSQVFEYLPRFEYISSSEYRQPDILIQRTLQGVVDSCIRPINKETQKNELLTELSTIQQLLQEALNTKISEITEVLRRFYPNLISVQVNSNIDFLKSFTTANLMLDFGDGPQFLNTFGEGTKKKVWMCFIDWEKQVHKEENPSIFRVYDEPDINLDYSAERKLFGGILESTRIRNSKMQSIVSTHSVTLIDRAPIQSIRLIKLDEGNSRNVEFFDGDIEDDDVIPFMFNVGSSVGIANSLVLYEKAFLVVEGESEENAIPILYRNLYGRSILEDGIVLVNLFTYSSWKTTLKFLGSYRSNLTVVLLDADCKTTNPGSRLTIEALSALRYPPDFINSNCFFIGTKEFEDAFHNDDLLTTLNRFYPKENSETWECSDIEPFREGGRKFGKELVKHVRSNCQPLRRSSMSKPEFAAKLASQCCEPSQVPQAIHDVFELLRQKAGVGETLQL